MTTTITTSTLGLAFVGLSLAAGCLGYESAGGPESKRGLTWEKYRHDEARGQDQVGCGSGCDAYVGDTACSERRPILCIARDGSGSKGFVPSFHDGWAAGTIGVTSPVAGTTLASRGVADRLCKAQFGDGWRMAEHHDGGGGWVWRAYGDLDERYRVGAPGHRPGDRFWVAIDDQPANCWDR